MNRTAQREAAAADELATDLQYAVGDHFIATAHRSTMRGSWVDVRLAPAHHLHPEQIGTLVREWTETHF